MKTNTNIGKALIPTLLATIYTIPALPAADEQPNTEQKPAGEKAQTPGTSAAVQQEVIQLLRKDDSDRVTLNIAGQPGTHFRTLYSATGVADSYAPVPKGEGVIGENGLASVDFELKKLGKDEVYLKVKTSAKADFSESRVTPKPIILEVEKVQVKERGFADKFETRTPSAVAGVRG